MKTIRHRLFIDFDSQEAMIRFMDVISEAIPDRAAVQVHEADALDMLGGGVAHYVITTADTRAGRPGALVWSQP